MGNKRQRLEDNHEELEKKIKNANTVTQAFKLTTGIGCTMSAVAMLMGGLAGIVADGVMDYTVQNVYEQDSYQASIRDRQRQLTDALVNGDISYKEFKREYESLYTVDEVIDYSKTANDKNLSKTVEDYYETKEVATSTLTKAVPTMLGIACAGAAGISVTEAIRKKYEAKLKDVQSKLNDDKEMGE